jgi:hypothetical protein
LMDTTHLPHTFSINTRVSRYAAPCWAAALGHKHALLALLSSTWVVPRYRACGMQADVFQVQL